MTYAFHPFADIFPLLDGAELEELVTDIKKSGLLEPIVLLEGKILDGRNRHRACIAAGVEPIFQDFTGGDPAAYVISANIHRRHLTAKRKRDLIAKLTVATPEKSDRQIAETVKVDHKTVGAVRAQQEARGEIPHVKTRTDTKGRKQPARKPPRRPAKKKREIIDERQALARRLVAVDRELVVLLSKFFGKYPDQVDAFFADVSISATEIEERDEKKPTDTPETSAEAMKATFAAADDGLDIPECLRRDRVRP